MTKLKSNKPSSLKRMCNKVLAVASWCCWDCGMKYGSKKCGLATWHRDYCDVCNDVNYVTEPRDFGYLSMANVKKSKGAK